VGVWIELLKRFAFAEKSRTLAAVFNYIYYLDDLTLISDETK